ncbi:MAG: Uma2 family endonuclease [Zavarzinella sp.]|nr:Uma2 family endonuclease [Zavarzinella sp.]
MPTSRDLADLPEDDHEHWLIRGHLRTSADRFHTRDQGEVTSRLSYWLCEWCDRHSDLGLRVYSCAHCRLARDPDTVLLAHVTIARPDSWVTVRGRDRELIDGPPALIVDVVDVRDDPALVAEREECYSAVRGAAVWVIDPGTRQGIVYENGQPCLVSAAHGGVLTAACLPGLVLDIRDVFDD